MTMRPELALPLAAAAVALVFAAVVVVAKMRGAVRFVDASKLASQTSFRSYVAGLTDADLAARRAASREAFAAAYAAAVAWPPPTRERRAVARAAKAVRRMCKGTVLERRFPVRVALLEAEIGRAHV